MEDIGMIALFELIIWVPLSLIVGSLIGAKWLKWSGVKCFGLAVTLLLAPFLYGYVQFLAIDHAHSQYCEKYKSKILYKKNITIPDVISIQGQTSDMSWDLLSKGKIKAIIASDKNGYGMTGKQGFYKISLAGKEDPRCEPYWRYTNGYGHKLVPKEKCIAVEGAAQGVGEAKLILEYKDVSTRLAGPLGKHFTLYELSVVNQSDSSVLAQRAQILYSSAPHFYEYLFRSQYASCNQRLGLPEHVSPIDYFFGLN